MDKDKVNLILDQLEKDKEVIEMDMISLKRAIREFEKMVEKLRNVTKRG